MKSRHIIQRDLSIADINLAFKDADKFYHKLKDLEGIKYIDKLIDGEIFITGYSYSCPTLHIQDATINLDIICSVIGEIELALDANSDKTTVNSSYEDKQVRYALYSNKDGRILDIYVYNPSCEWIVKETKIHQHSSNYESVEVLHDIKCI